MILLNFAHPITPEQRAQVEAQIAGQLADILDVPCSLDQARPFAAQIAALLDGVPLSPAEWQSGALLVNPPGLAPAACALIAELHGRMGHFPTLIRLRPVEEDNQPRRFVLAEIVNLNQLRDAGRRRRGPGE